MERFLFAGALWVVIGACLYAMRRRSPLHLFVLAAISTALVGTFFPVMSVFVEPSSWRNVVQAPDERILEVQGEYLAYAVGLCLALAIACALRGKAESPAVSGASSARAVHRDRLVAASLVLVGAALYAAYVARIGLSTLLNRDDYAEKYLLSQGLGPLAFGLNFMIAGCLWAEGSDVSRALRTAFRIVAIGIAIWSIAFISVRTNFVVLCIGYAWIHARKRGFQLARVRFSLIVLLVLVYAGLEAFSLYRGVAHDGDLSRGLALIGEHASDSVASVVGGSELSHPFLTTLEVGMYERAGDLGGQSFVDAIPAFLPNSMYPDHPLTLSEHFTSTHYGDVAERGGGAAFSLVAEAWWNFGSIAGPLAIGFLFAALILFVERAAARDPSGVLARLAPYFVYLVIIAHRSESAIFVKQGVSILLPALALSYAAEVVWLARRPSTSSRARVATR